MRCVLLLVAMGVVEFAPATVWSAPITIRFAGTITEIASEDPMHLQYGPNVAELGEEFSGTYSIDPGDVTGMTRHAIGASPRRDDTLVSYSLAARDSSLSVVIGHGHVDGMISNVSIYDDLYNGHGESDGWSTWLVTPEVRVGIRVVDMTATRLSDDDFFVNASLAGWDYARLLILNVEPDRVMLVATGTIDTLYLVPEPSTAPLVSLGIVVMTSRRRNLQRAGQAR